jgi:uncharacterized RDD family membrane protein YckC
MLGMEESKKLHSHDYSFILHPEKLLKKRVLAFSIDLFAILMINKFMTISFMFYLEKYSWPVYRMLKSSAHLINEAEVVTLLVIYFSYFFMSMFLSQGKTLGKTAVGLRVIDPQTLGQITYSQAMLRTMGYTLCYLGALILFALPFLNRKNKGVPDWLSSTQVISEDQWKALSIFHEQQQIQVIKKFKVLEMNISGNDEEDKAA